MTEGGRIRVLIVAPQPEGTKPLGWAAEFSGLAALAGVELKIVGSDKATLDAVSTALREVWDIVVWSGHGRPGFLAVVDGEIDGGWLAGQLGYCPPRVVVLAACYSADVTDDGISGMAHQVSDTGVDCIGMRDQVDDGAAIVFTREFVRAVAAGVGIGQAKRVAERMARSRHPGVGEVELVPGMVNGTRVMAVRMRCVEEEVAKLGVQVGSLEGKVDLVIQLVRATARP